MTPSRLPARRLDRLWRATAIVEMCAHIRRATPEDAVAAVDGLAPSGYKWILIPTPNTTPRRYHAIHVTNTN